MNYPKAVGIFNQLMECENSFLKDELLDSIIRYARIRTDWYFMSIEDKKDKDDLRTLTHNALISNLHALIRNIDGYTVDELLKDRKIIGDWACFVHAYLGILNR